MKTTPQEEAEVYKNYPKKHLKKVIATYKFFKLLNDDTLNFVFSYLTVIVPQILIFGFSFGILLFSVLFHFFVCWLYMVKYKNIKLVTDEEKEEIVVILKILKDYLN